MALLSEEEKRRIEAAIREVEGHTAGELVVAIARQSSDYALTRAVAALLWATALALLTHYLWPGVGAGWLLLPLPAAFALFYWLWGLPPLLRLLLPRAAVEQAVVAKAFELFARQGLYLTRANTGLLVLVSEREHHVVLLGDRGLDIEIQESGWRRHTDDLTAAIRAGRATEGLLAVIAAIGGVLAEKHPRPDDDTNELDDHVIEL